MELEQEKITSENGYSLDFLKHPEVDFKSQMLNYIKTRFSHLLTKADLELLASGDPKALDLISNKCREGYSTEKFLDV